MGCGWAHFGLNMNHVKFHGHMHPRAAIRIKKMPRYDKALLWVSVFSVVVILGVL